MLLPLKHNDGQPIPGEKLSQTREELLAHFGAISAQPGVIQGTWIHGDTRYEDELLRLVIDVDDTPENHQFFVEYKTLLLERYRQLAIYIASYPVDIL
jgi:hypothetical protein